MREDYYAGLEDRYFLTFDQAKKQRLVIDFDATPPAPSPSNIGVTVISDVKLEDVVPYIDWVSLLSLSFEFSFYVVF
jgi:5-methyltetrahydrofolate--homocysteine methyltransferase